MPRLIWTLMQPHVPGPITACCGAAMVELDYQFTRDVDTLVDLLEARRLGQRVAILHNRFLSEAECKELLTRRPEEAAEIECGISTHLTPDQLFKMLVVVDSVPTMRHNAVHARNARRWPRKAFS